jgi:hypothetical protein
MATIVPKVTSLDDEKGVLVLWETLTQTNTTGGAVTYPEYSDRSVQVIGTFDSATITLQGSNDGTNFYSLSVVSGTTCAFTAAGLKGIFELPRYIRPILTGGTTSDLDVYLFMRRGR